MKKFLTVLLALSVVFTYTVGTAFALPSDGTDVAGLKAAKAEATATLEKTLDDLSDYTEAGQKLIEAAVIEGKEAIEKAETNTDVSAALKAATDKIDALKQNHNRQLVAKAISDAKTQIKDYLYLFGQNTDANANLNGPVANGNIQLDGLGFEDGDKFVAEYNKQITKLGAAISVSEVNETLIDTIEVIDKHMKTLSNDEVTDAQRKALVDAILKKAENSGIKSTTHSAAVIKKYDAVVDEAIAAAKAAKTMTEYYDVVNKYLGTEDALSVVKNASLVKPTPSEEGYVAISGGHAYILVNTIGELNKLSNMTKDVEKKISVLKDIQAELGQYDYTTIKEGDWSQAEAIRYEVAYYIENGAWDLSAVDYAGKPVGNFMALIDQITAADPAKTVDTKKANALAQYEALNILNDIKADAKATINSFYGYDLDESKAALADYTNQDQIIDLQELYCQYVDASATADQVNSYVEKYMAKVDAYNTADEAKVAKYAGEVCAYIDTAVADLLTDIKLSADQNTLKNRIVADLKAAVNAGEIPANWETKNADDKLTAVKAIQVPNADGTDADFSTVITGLKTYDGTNLYGYGTLPQKANATEYSPANQKYLDAYQAELAAAAANVDNWSAFFTAYDAQVAKAAALKTMDVEAYEAAVKAAEAKIAALGNAELTSAFKSKLATADTAVAAVDTAYAAIDNLSDKAKASLAGISNYAAYEKASYDYEYLKYQDSLKKDVSEPYVVLAYRDIAKAITSSDILKKFAKADQQKILEIVTTATDKIDAAATDDAKIAAAEDAIAALRAFVPASDGRDYAAALAANKEEAVKYFSKYYNAAFTSEAGSATALINDILAFNEKLMPDPSADALKAEVKGTHMKIFSSAKKGYIKISWKKSNSNVALDGVEVYRSTKKTSGFKKISTFKKQTAKKYTKNLKKGTKYYFYVKGYKMVGDEKVYTHKSITVARTFRK